MRSEISRLAFIFVVALSFPEVSRVLAVEVKLNEESGWSRGTYEGRILRLLTSPPMKFTPGAIPSRENHVMVILWWKWR